MNSARAWTVWTVSLIAYFLAVLHRTSLGVAGPEATERFDASAVALASLAVLQLVVYAALQIPVGVLADSFGPRTLILVGAAVMASGQAIVAVADVLPVAIIGRMLVGAGDAATFISVMRLLPSWFRGPILPQLSQWTGNIGQLGQLCSALPFAWALSQFGWSWSFGSLAIASVLGVVLCAFVLRDAPAGVVPTHTGAIQLPASWWVKLRESIVRPGTQLGFWAHFSTQSPGTAFMLLWGFPTLVSGLGYEHGFAAALMTIVVVAGIVSGPLLGLLTARFPSRRSNLVLAIIGQMVVAWAAMVLWPGHPPLGVVIWMLIAIGIGGPGSLIGFDFARTFNPVRSLGSANGFVNVGGFTASFCMMAVIGVVLDVTWRARTSAGEDVALYDWDSLRLAWCIVFVALALGVAMLLRARAKTRRRMQEEDGITVAPFWSTLLQRMRRRGGDGGEGMSQPPETL